MKKSLSILSVVTLIFIIIAYFVGGFDNVREGFQISIKTAIQSALMLFVSFLVVGQIHVLITREKLDRWLKRFSGFKGIVISALAGGLFPGGPYVYIPFIQSFNEKGMPFYIFISFIFGKGVYDFARIPMEISLVDSSVTLIRNLITLPIPLIIGMLARRLYQNKSFYEIFKRKDENHDFSDDHS